MGLNNNPSQPAYLIPGLPSGMGNSAIIGTDASGNLAALTTLIVTPATYGGDRKSTRLNSSHTDISRMPSSA